MTDSRKPSISLEAGTHCVLDVEGMDCPSCADQITRSVQAIEGVQNVRVDIVGGKVRVDYVEGMLSRGDLRSTLRQIGFQVAEPRAAVFIVEGMDCADETRQIEAVLGSLPGVTSLQFDVLRQRLIVEGAITSAEVKRALGTIGMRAGAENESQSPSTFWQRRGRRTMAAISGICLAVGVALEWLALTEEIAVPLYATSAIAGGWFVAPRAWRSLRHRTLDMNFLMVVAAIGAAGIGEWAEGASVMFLFSLAQLLESWSMDRVRSAIKALMELSPTEATVKREGRDVIVSPADVAIGEIVVIRPGGKIPLDGEVMSGNSSVNQAPITGESIPVEKGPGDEVFAGSINEHGLLQVRVTKHVEDTTLARIVHAVEEAQASRAPSQSFVDRFSRIYTPFVVVVAATIIIFPPLLGTGAWSVWFYRALAMLVIACPCALVISTPVSIVSGLAGAARRGVLIKGGLHLENVGAVTVIVFDKTGTLTLGRPLVTDVMSLGRFNEGDVLRLAAALERGSEHSLAKAILEKASREEDDVSLAVEHFQALVGRGISGAVDGRLYYLGNERLLEEHAIDKYAVEKPLKRFKDQGKTAVILFDDDEPLGIIALADELRPSAAKSVVALRAAGIRRIIMLTGDNTATAQMIAGAAGLDDYQAELLPDDKVQVVKELEQSGERVAFIGDGVNDAPALAAASVGIAMGAAGTDVAIETADIALMADDLLKVEFAIRLSQKTGRIIRQNIVFSIVIKILVAVFAVVGWATLWMAVAADMGSSLAVTANGMRCRWTGQKEKTG